VNWNQAFQANHWGGSAGCGATRENLVRSVPALLPFSHIDVGLDNAPVSATRHAAEAPLLMSIVTN